MPWNEASELILANIRVGLELEPDRENPRPVIAVNYLCNTYNYRGEIGFLISIGQDNTIEIPMSMLQQVYKAATENGGICNRSIIYELYPLRVNHHGCHVHVVGRLFSHAGVMNAINHRNYQVLV